MLLTGRSQHRVSTHACLLRDAGHIDVGMVGRIAEGMVARDTRRRGGRADAGLPWIVRIDSARFVGDGG